GDEGITEPYFYITAYPFPEDITNINLSGSAYWHTEGWNGAIYTYSDLLKSEDSQKELLKFFEEVLTFVSNKMK
ncbi:MAG: hypothetical protein D6830_00675, partial [Ignavibacteria bacterium]